jgi:DNA recombination protein RmuC
MSHLATLLLTLLASATSAMIGIWYGSRLRGEKVTAGLALARSEFAVEMARSQERSNALDAQLRQTQTHCSDAEAALRVNELRLIATLESNARLEGRASKVESLEHLLESANRELTDSRAALSNEREIVAGATARVEAAEIRTDRAEQALVDLSRDHSQMQNELGVLKESSAELRTALQSEKEKIQILMTAREDLLSQFKLSASEILDDKSKLFAEQNIEALGNLLNPVKEKLAGFQAKVEEVYRTEGQERAALGAQLKQLLGLNQTLSQDAQNLTRALKGDRKTQGVWGEVLLDSVLEMAGLIEGTHFDRQSTHESEDQKRNVPDIVLRLPGDRHLVIDSKVSLTAYEKCMSCETSDERAAHLRQHIASVRAHIKNLSEKRYQSLYGLKSLDFVLLFVPLEPAFATAVSNDNQIFREAWDRNVILVSPSTMLFVVRTVAYLWRQDAQTRNVVEIARRGGELYDKFCGFIEDLELVGQRIEQARTAYDSSFKKLSTGQGNLVRQAQMLRDLGLKPTKNLPSSVVEFSLES